MKRMASDRFLLTCCRLGPLCYVGGMDYGIEQINAGFPARYSKLARRLMTWVLSHHLL